jgi:hypothetical protein
MKYAVFTKDGFGGAELQTICDSADSAKRETRDLRAMGFALSELKTVTRETESEIYEIVDRMESGQSFARAIK